MTVIAQEIDKGRQLFDSNAWHGRVCFRLEKLGSHFSAKHVGSGYQLIEVRHPVNAEVTLHELIQPAPALLKAEPTSKQSFACLCVASSGRAARCRQPHARQGIKAVLPWLKLRKRPISNMLSSEQKYPHG